jgi:uncharacterized OB-fold protein
MTAERDYSKMLTLTFEYPMPYEWSVGKHGSRFFQEIREKRRFIGIRCPKCGMVYVPPRRLCGPCFQELEELVPLSDTGTITAFSVVDYPFIDPDTGERRPVPYTYGYIRIDGSDNIFSHIINETDVSRIRVGMKVRAVFKESDEMQGNIQDIKYFEIIG